MGFAPAATCPISGLPLLIALLPGADRRRTPSVYQYRVTYRNPTGETPGCVMAWEAQGGRQPYQIALEREPTGKRRWHCTCADHVYRAENEGRHCKHIRGLLDFVAMTH